MQLAKVPALDSRGLRQFGLTTGGIVACLFGIILPWIFEASWPLWPWIIAAILAAWGLAAPASLGPVYRAWMRIGMLLSKVTTPIILTLVFFATIVPGSIIMRSLKKDPMRRGFDRSGTYRIKSTTPSIGNMENPY